MLITIGLSVWFYWSYAIDPDALDREISSLLIWLYGVMIVTISATLLFSVYYFFKQWKKMPKKLWQSATSIVMLGFLFTGAYFLGNGDSLNIVGYKGNENTYIWLKLTDMWLYSIYVLLALAFISLLGGILWSYFKKVK
jgi:hypothetical protein